LQTKDFPEDRHSIPIGSTWCTKKAQWCPNQWLGNCRKEHIGILLFVSFVLFVASGFSMEYAGNVISVPGTIPAAGSAIVCAIFSTRGNNFFQPQRAQ
jgi:hypothetical protein